jgi:hypothetical protein
MIYNKYVNKIKRLCLLLAGLMIWAVALPAMATSRYVSLTGGNVWPYTNWPDAATNIEWAVNAGVNGDTVWISNGTYVLTNQITVQSNLTIRGVGGLVKVDGNNGCRCFQFVNAIGILSNLFITRGYANDNGGGVWMRTGTVQNCVFSNNSCQFNGGGMYITNGGGTFQSCTFIDNRATNGGGMYISISTCRIDHCLVQTNYAGNNGGGLYVANDNEENGKASTITGCDFICNVASNYGGGAYIANGSGGRVQNCTFTSNITQYISGAGVYLFSGIMDHCYLSNNIAGSAGYGGGIWMYYKSAVQNCVVTRNSAIKGAGIFQDSAPILPVLNCIIEENQTMTANGLGGGISTAGGIVRNCLIRNNYGYGGGGINCAAVTISSCTIVSNYAYICRGGGIRGSSATICENSIIYFNGCVYAESSNVYVETGNASFSNCCSAPATIFTNSTSTNNIVADPQFINWPNGNYHLANNSPCINSGINRAWMDNASDLDGAHHRIDGFSHIVDMGCYEYLPSGIICRIGF